jgi:hypothetical protein
MENGQYKWLGGAGLFLMEVFDCICATQGSGYKGCKPMSFAISTKTSAQFNESWELLPSAAAKQSADGYI